MQAFRNTLSDVEVAAVITYERNSFGNRQGDMIQVTKVSIEDDKILLEINGGLKTGRKWYERVEVGMGNRTSPVGGTGNPTLGSNIALVFPKGVPPLSAAELKKILLTGHRDEFAATVTEKLLTYALGRGLEAYDAPAIRTIMREAAKDDYRLPALINAIINSQPFQMRRTPIL